MISLPAAAPGLLDYFGQSNLAGQLIVIILVSASVAAWTVMVGKWIELRSLRRLNREQKRTISQLESLCRVALSKYPEVEATLSQAFKMGLIAYHNEVRIFGSPSTELSRNRCMKNVENAMSRTIAKSSIHYERYMTTLGSIVTAAPFLGLLGTVWGVMEAFGGVANGGNATLQHLAPGVSGALLTTVAALAVAIPSVVGYNYLVSYIKAMIVELENDSSEIAEQLENEISMSDSN
jgi:biopolymer transport protein TolQ